MARPEQSALIDVPKPLALTVDQSMAIGAQSNQIFFAVVSQVALGFDVMDLQIRSLSTGLAPPPITPQDLLA